MPDLSRRSYQKEILDRDDIPFADIRQNMQELNTINKWLGGHAITIGGVKTLLKLKKDVRPVRICEIGCGGGDNLQAIDSYCNQKNIQANFIGIDIKPECIEFARQQYPSLNAAWIIADYQQADLRQYKPDIIFSSLFCHHFTDDALISMLQWMQTHAKCGFFINDLHRHPLAWYSIKTITSMFSRSYLVKNDAPLSVARGFKKKEWEQLLKQAGITNYSIQWKWAFRYLITCSND